MSSSTYEVRLMQVIDNQYFSLVHTFLFHELFDLRENVYIRSP